MALRGELTEYASFLLTWPFIDDAALTALGALDDDRAGARYLAAGRNEDAMSLAAFCNLGCAIAGVAHRVDDVPAERLGERLGSMRAYAERKPAVPMIDPSETVRRLGLDLVPVEAGVERTVRWLKDNGLF